MEEDKINYLQIFLPLPTKSTEKNKQNYQKEICNYKYVYKNQCFLYTVKEKTEIIQKKIILMQQNNK